MKRIFDEIASWIPMVIVSTVTLLGLFSGLILIYYWILDLVS